MEIIKSVPVLKLANNNSPTQLQIMRPFNALHAEILQQCNDQQKCLTYEQFNVFRE
jgi:hypothetical protein